MERKVQTRRKPEPIDDTGYSNVCVAMVGNVDVGKSTTIGTLVTGKADDGRGSSRASVFVHPHEHETGRTSDISYQYIKDEESKRIMTFVDLCGHKMYLRTTVSGLSASFPDLAVLCVFENLTEMTKEHLQLCIAMNIPFVILFTKSDFANDQKVKTSITECKAILHKEQNKKCFEIKTVNDIKTLGTSLGKTVIPYIRSSNKTLAGIDLLREIFRTCERRPRTLVKGFSIEHIYNVTGYGTVLSGIAGESIKIGDSLHIGPLDKNQFITVKVKSIHNDFRYNLRAIDAGKKGCICIAISKDDRQRIRKGLILKKDVPENVCKRFLANIKVSNHHTTLKPGFVGSVNIGTLRESVKFVNIYDAKMNNVEKAMSGDDIIIEMEFVKNLNYVEPNQNVLFREGQLRGYGNVIKIIPIE